MPQVEVTIGGRAFEVACQSGEEPYLRAAAQMLDAEAVALSAQIGRMPEAKMLLMAGLMLADKTAGLEERLREAEARVAEMARMVEALETAPPEIVTERVEVRVEVPVEKRVEVPVETRVEVPVERVVEVEKLVEVPAIPEAHVIRLAELAAEAEALAEQAARL